MANLCIIPARGGSKRIPGKNIKDFFGKPIISYSINAAFEASIFDEIMVSTDNDEIAGIAKEYGAKVPFMRSKTNSNDFASTFEVIREVLDNYLEQGKKFDIVCCIYPCAPLITSDILKASLAKLTNEYEAVIPIIPFSFPIQQAYRLEGKNISYMNPEFEKVRSQDLEKAYHDPGQFYFIKTEASLNEKTLIPKRTTFIELNEMEVQDIDNEMDWKLAELKYQARSNEVS